MTTAIVRADGSSTLGLGHIMRGIAFGEKFKRMGVFVTFVSRNLDTSISDLIKAKGFNLVEITPADSFIDDLEITCSIAKDISARIIVTDICHKETQLTPKGLENYHSGLSDYFTIVMAGDKVSNLPCDLLVNPYVGRENELKPYKSRLSKKDLFGPSFFIFREQFVKAAKVIRTIKPSGQRVLVTMGGGDDMHFSIKVLGALMLLCHQTLKIKVAVGQAFSAKLRNELTRLLSRSIIEHKIIYDSTELAKEMLWADLAITSDGLTKYETAVTGTPSIVFTRPENDRMLGDAFANFRTCIQLSKVMDLNVVDLSQKIQQVLVDETGRRSMSINGKGLVDGQGLDRIISNVPKAILT